MEAGPKAIRCLNGEEALATFAQMNVILDGRDALRGSDILAMLTPDELACVQEGDGSEALAGIPDATVIESFKTSEAMFGCIEPGNLASIFISVSDSRLGGLSPDTISCAESALEAAQERDPHPHLIEFAFGIVNEPPEHYGEAVSLSREIFACMSDLELLKVQKAIADSLHLE